jgi:hypothetical protein
MARVIGHAGTASEIFRTDRTVVYLCKVDEEYVVFVAGELERVLVAMPFDDPQVASRVFGWRLLQIRRKRKSALAAL